MWRLLQILGFLAASAVGIMMQTTARGDPILCFRRPTIAANTKQDVAFVIFGSGLCESRKVAFGKRAWGVLTATHNFDQFL